MRRNNTVHAISFGIWDLWHLIGQDLNLAESSANRSLNTLFDQLHGLADKWDPFELKIILTLTIDPSFLPGFSPTAENHKKTVKLIEFWNKEMRTQAEQWDRGTIFLFDTNAFMLDHIRDRQLYIAGLNDSVDPEESETDWRDVSSACMKRNGTETYQSPEPCSNPEQYLFW